MTNATRTPAERPEFCEMTGERLFRAGEYAAPGEYVETETGRSIALTSPDYLPARLDGKVAYYRRIRGYREKPEEPSLARRQAQFQYLMAQTYPRLYHFARRSVGNPQDAEDVTQETFARAWMHFESFDARRSFDAWVFRIAGNILIDQSRRRRRRQEISLDTPAVYQYENGGDKEGPGCPELADSAGNPQDCLMAKEISAELRSALRSLPPLHQTILMLVAQQRSYAQIASTLDCPVGTIRSRVYRARVMLRRTMEGSGSALHE